MYRARLGSNLDEITLDYVSSISDDAEIALYDIIGSQAHTIMLYQNKILTKKETKKILSALERLKKQKLDKNSQHEDIHELIESLVIKNAGTTAGGKMHTARSRNDQVSLDIRMKIRDDINILCNCLLDLIEALVSVAKANQKTVMPLYTHLQQAQAGFFSHYLLSYADSLFRDLDRLYFAYARVNESPLGAGPVGGTSLPIDRHLTAKILGFRGIVENSIDATGTRDFVAEFLGDLAILMTNLSRMAEDFVIWSSTEFSFIELSDNFSSPSSVMPQKKNPDILELTRAKTAQIIGNLTSVLCTIKGLSSGYGRDLQEIKPPLLSSSKTVIGALLVTRGLILTMKVNKERMKKATQGGYLVALDLAEKLVKKGVPFRSSHKIVGRLVSAAHSSKKPLLKITQPELKESVRGTGVDAKILSEILQSTTVASSLGERSSLGSSGVSEQKRMIENRMKKVRLYREGVFKRENTVKTTLSNLSKKVKELTK